MVVHTGGAMLSPMVSEWASAFVTSDTLHWELKSVNQARQWRTSSQWTFVQCVHCAANIVTCDIPDIVHCANSLPVLCPASQPSVTHQIETQNLFHSFTLSTESQNSNHQVGFFLFFQVLIWYCLYWAKLKKHMHQRHSMGSSRLKQVSMSLQTFLIPTFQLLHPKIHMDHIWRWCQW